MLLDSQEVTGTNLKKNERGGCRNCFKGGGEKAHMPFATEEKEKKKKFSRPPSSADD